MVLSPIPGILCSRQVLFSHAGGAVLLGSRHHFGFTGISRSAGELRGAFRPILDRVMAVATDRAQRHRWAPNHLHDQHAPCIRQPRKSQVEGHSFPSWLG